MANYCRAVTKSPRGTTWKTEFVHCTCTLYGVVNTLPARWSFYGVHCTWKQEILRTVYNMYSIYGRWNLQTVDGIWSWYKG
jgi:hypothetical protein